MSGIIVDLKPDDSSDGTAQPVVQLARPVASTEPFLHCSDTWRALATSGTFLPNRPVQEATWAAIHGMQEHLLRKLEDHFGVAVTLTYGFAGPELVKAIEKRAAAGGWLPNITPRSDQHAGYELNSRGNRICKHDGIAVDLRVPGISSEIAAQWVMDNLPFDAIYLYSADRPFHMSWAPLPRGTVVRMKPKKDGGLYPSMVRRGELGDSLRAIHDDALTIGCMSEIRGALAGGRSVVISDVRTQAEVGFLRGSGGTLAGGHQDPRRNGHELGPGGLAGAVGQIRA